MSWGFLPVTIAAGAVLLAAGCASSSSEPTASSEAPVPTATRPDPEIVVQVDCGADGLANVVVSYGTAPDEKVLVGKKGDSQTFSGNYITGPGYADAPLTVTTSPLNGTCKTTITDYNSGDVLAERETAGRAILKAVVPGDPGQGQS